MRHLLLGVLIALSSASFAQDWAKMKLGASPRHQEWVKLQSGGRDLHCFVVYPEVKDKAKVVVLIHEIMGLTDWVMSVADELAAQGYIAIAPDFLSGAGPGGGRSKDFPDVGAAREAVSALSLDQVTADLNSAVDYGRSLPSANGKVAVAGFCWGGGQSFRFATSRPDISAAFVFYGTPPNPDSMATLKAPVYGFYGGNDNRVTATVDPTKEDMSKAGKAYEPVVYEGAGHGFMRSGQQPDATPENKKARDTAWSRWLEILSKL
ncbi:MAG: dienelactone hydrolase family protein [Armatimonadetes bacterium]|nr:dienelactone hydrolase family protein [Armatimonadota bacterium]